MRIAVLTTQTPHHARFVAALAGDHEIAGVLLETEPAATAPFETAHPFERDRDAYECLTWFDGNNPGIEDFAPVQAFSSLNDPAAATALRDLEAEATIVFGTGKLKPPLIDLMPRRILNLHGGDPQDYRGLDSHLWAIYHGDFNSLVSCMHLVEPELDTGAVVNKRPIPLTKGMELYQLRLANTEVCIELADKTLSDMSRGGMLTLEPIQRVGRYYSFMPTVLKDLCLRKFKRYTESLP